MSWRAEAGAATHVGMVRDGNEDAMLVESPLYVVADGMGGHQGGEVASALAISTLAATLRTRRSGASGLIASIEEANAAVYERQQLDRSLAGMGTTITAAFLDDDGLHLGQVGDSRAYLLRGGALTQLTDDHSLVSEMVRSGEITSEQARTHPQRSMLTRALGIDKSVHVDAFDVELADGDRVLLCSDGMTAIASDDEIADLLRAGDDPTTTAEALVALANRVGGPDNTTVVVLDIVDDPTQATPTVPPSSSEATPAVPPNASKATPKPGTGETDSGPGSLLHSKLIWGAVGFLVLVAIAIPLWTRAHWYVGVADSGRIAIYHGMPFSILGIPMHSLDEETTVVFVQANALLPGVVAGIDEGVVVSDRAAAEQLVARIEATLASLQPALTVESGSIATPPPSPMPVASVTPPIGSSP